MNTLTKVVATIATIVSFLGCQAPESTWVVSRHPQLTDDDREVMQAVLDQTLRPNRDRLRPHIASAISPPFFVFDSTIEVCPEDPITYSRHLECVSTGWLNHLDRLGLQSSSHARVLFTARNSQAMPIGGALADDVVDVPSASVNTTQGLGEFVRRYPPKSVGPVILFSAPIYSEDRSAVIFYHQLWGGGGFVHFRWTGTTWVLVKTSTWVE
jgi:hypothetical protein